MFVSKKWMLFVMSVALLPATMATAAVQLKFNMDSVPGDGDYFDGTNPANYNGINWDLDLEDNGETLGLDPNTLAGVNGQNIPDAIDFVTGAATGISLTVTSENGFNEAGPNRDGTFSPGAPASNFFDSEATDFNLFGHTSNFNVGGARDLVEYTIAGLSSTALYDFTFFASRLGASENRETQYDVAGATSGSGSLNPSDNEDNIAQVLQAQPNGSGELTLTIQAGPNNASSDKFFYLGAFEILENGAVAGQAGDFDADLDVDGTDFLVWQRDTNVGSLATWSTNYSAGATATFTSVPEPTSAMLLLFGLLGLGRVARTRR